MSQLCRKQELSEMLSVLDFLLSILILPLSHEWHIPQVSLIPQICHPDRSISPHAYHSPS